ncbi:sigma-54-dependent Fis family transcriptional regulator [Microbacterium lacus]|uniref:Helix-turn-helix domain-containing protein n=1 Tax=Microbacterium lacus TaxID=415217 RepID=A0ABN2G382_9MICO
MTTEFDPKLTESLKERVLGEAPGAADPQAEIISSWRRSQAALGDPGRIRDVPHVPDTLLDEHLLDMFGAPMNRFAQDLEGTGLAVLLADSRGQILHRWTEDRQARSHLDRVGTTRGAVLAENVVGTNGVGSVAATARPMQIRGTEHYAEIYRDAVCTGAPVFHPITGTLLAVVTLSCDLTPRTDLLKPLVKSMTTQLEQHVLSVEHPDARRMFHVFLEQSRRHALPVVAFGPQGVMIQSPQANALTPSDVAILRSIGDETGTAGRYVVELSGGTREVDITSVGNDNNVVVVGDRIRSSTSHAAPPPSPKLEGRSAEWLSARSEFEKLRAARTPVIVAGEVGVGKTTLALGVPYRTASIPSDRTLVDAAERHILGTREWLMQLRETATVPHDLVIRGVETLDGPALDGMRAVLEARGATGPTTLTMTTTDRSSVESMELQFGAQMVWLAPLRERAGDIPDLWRALRAAVAPGVRLDVDEAASRLIETYHWPGNVKELRQLVSQLASVTRTGPVTPRDLPPAMHAERSLTLIERVELEAIRKALHEANGNRSKAADILGLSRATVYRKMKAYRLGDG